MALEGYDLVMLGILAAAALLGYFKGMVWQLAWIAGIVASSYVAFRFGVVLAPYFGTQAPWNRFAAMLALYAGTSIVVWVLFRAVSGVINAVHLSAFDHQLGLLLGLAKGCLMCVVITFFAVTLAPAYRQQIVGSRSGRIIAQLIVQADSYLPKEIHETVDPFVKQFERQFQAPPGAPAAIAGGPAAFAGGPSPLKAMWDGVTSAAAWAGSEQGAGSGQGAVHAGGVLPPGTTWFVPKAAEPPSGNAAASPGRFMPPPAAAPMPANAAGVPAAFGGQPPPQRYPSGAQSPLRPW